MRRNRTIIKESDLHKIVKESVKRILRESGEEEWKPKDGYFYSISSMEQDDFGDWMDYACYEEEGGFDTPEDAYNEGLDNLKYYTQGDFSLSVYFFDDNGAGDYVSGYYAEVHDGELTEY